jgi:elongation factor G
LINPQVWREGDNRQIIHAALEVRRDLISALADVDDVMGDLYLQAMDCQVQVEGSGVFDSCPIASNITTVDIQSAIRRATLNRSIMRTMCGAALRGLGVDPVLDGVAEWLPCPLD